MTAPAVWRSRIGGVLCAALTLAAVLAGAAAASEADGHATHRDWTVMKDEGSGCLVAQSVIGRRTGALLLQAVLDASAAPDGSVVLAMRVPTGASLPDGIAYRHRASDAVAVGLEWQSCDPERCTAMGRLSQAEFGRLMRGREIIVGYRPLPESRLLNVPLSLMGLTAAWRQAQGCRADAHAPKISRIAASDT